MSPSAYIVLTIFLFIPVSIGLTFAIVGIIKASIRKRREKERVANQAKMLGEEKEVSKYSRVVMKLSELDNIFAPYTDINYQHSFSGYDRKNSKREYDRSNRPSYYILNYYMDLAKSSLIEKRKHNSLVKQYMFLYNLTIENVHTPDEYIQKTVYSKEEFERIEKRLIKKMLSMREDTDPIRISVIMSYTSPKGRNHYSYTFRYGENDINLKFYPEKLKTGYIPRDVEWEKILAQREMVKSLPVFLSSINKIIAKKERTAEIASSIQVIGGVHYYIFDNYALVGGCEGDLKAVTIADTVSARGRDLPVTGILEKSFINSSNLKEILIPGTIEIIGDSAFSGCYQLKEIYLPDSVKYIGNKAFESCFSLSKASLVKDAFIESNSFEMCNKCTIGRR